MSLFNEENDNPYGYGYAPGGVHQRSHRRYTNQRIMQRQENELDEIENNNHYGYGNAPGGVQQQQQQHHQREMNVNEYGYGYAPGRSEELRQHQQQPQEAEDDNPYGYGHAPGRNEELQQENNSPSDEEQHGLMTERMQKERRASIQAIMADQSLTPIERRRSIQGLMDGRRKSMGSVPKDYIEKKKVVTITPREMVKNHPVCTHYNRNCSIIAPCCGMAFGCRICHDECPTLPPMSTSYKQQNGLPLVSEEGEEETQHVIDRFQIAEIICRVCFTRQSSKTNRCFTCNIRFGEYHCAVCNLWMDAAEQPYHCADCGFCRLGGSRNYEHCKACGICIDKQLIPTHECKQGKYMSNCPVCQEDLFSSRAASHELPCGHAIHWHCYQEYSAFDSRCPVCKKTTESAEDMAETWREMALSVQMQPVPPELAKVVDISCNDCEKRSENCRWHILGVQCKHCRSFNTIVEEVHLTGEQALNFLQQLEEQERVNEIAAQQQEQVVSNSTNNIGAIEHQTLLQNMNFAQQINDAPDNDLHISQRSVSNDQNDLHNLYGSSYFREQYDEDDDSYDDDDDEIYIPPNWRRNNTSFDDNSDDEQGDSIQHSNTFNNNAAPSSDLNDDDYVSESDDEIYIPRRWRCDLREGVTV